MRTQHPAPPERRGVPERQNSGVGALMTRPVLLLVAVALMVLVSPAGGAATPAPECATANADSSFTVPLDWELKPSDMGSGDQFRLLFITSTLSKPTESSISEYNSFVQRAAQAGHLAISDSCAAQFKILGSTLTSATNNTGTTGVGVPIYWLNGARLTDNYADLYDGDWDDYGMTEENGRRVSYPVVLTGSNDDGTRAWVSGGGNYTLGTNRRDSPYVPPRVRTGDPTGAGSPLASGYQFTNISGRFYALSPVFTVAKPTVGFGETEATVNEGRATVTLEVTLSHPRGEATSLTINTTDGSAGANTDYAPGPYTGAIPAGQTSATVSIGIVNDSVAEVRESFQAEITGLPDDVTPEPDQTVAEITIVDDDGAGRLVITPSGPMELTEGGSGAYTVELASAPTHNVTVEVTSDDPDVTTGPATLTFMPGNWDTAQTVTVNSRPDYDIWDDTATLTHTTRSDDPNYEGTASTAVKRVKVPDSVIKFYDPIINFMHDSIVLNESQTGEIRIWLTLSEYSVGEVGVTITATSGTATEGQDFPAVNHRATVFYDYLTEDWTEIRLVLDDRLTEPDETFTLTLSDPHRARLGPKSTMTVTIAGDDYTISTASGATQTQVDEGAGHAEIKFKMSRALQRDTGVNIVYSPSTADPGVDFIPRPTRVIVPAGRTEFTVRIPIIDDDIIEGTFVASQLFQFTAIPDSGTGSVTHLVTISDNDSDNVEIVDDDIDALEVSPTRTLFEGQTKTITVTGIPTSFSIGTLLNEEDFYFITSNPIYQHTTETKTNPDQLCADHRDYNSEGVDICIKDSHWNEAEGIASIRLTALRDREMEGDEHVYVRVGAQFFDHRTYVFRVTVTDYATEYYERDNKLMGFFDCKAPIPTVADVFPGFRYEDLTMAQKWEFVDAVGTPTVYPPPPVVVAEWDQETYEDGDTATIRFRSQDEEGNPRRACASVRINYESDSQPDTPGNPAPFYLNPPGRRSLWEYNKWTTLARGETETEVSFPLRAGAEGNISFQVLGAFFQDRSGPSIRTIPVPKLVDRDGNDLGGTQTANVTCPAPCPSMGEVPPPEVKIAGAFSGHEGDRVGFTLGANPAPPDGQTLDVDVTITATGDFGVQTGMRTLTIDSRGHAELTLDTADDQVAEPDGTVTLTINPSPGYYTLGLPSVVTTGITDNDGPDDQISDGSPISDTQPPNPDAPPAPTPEITIDAGNDISEGQTATFTITAHPAPAAPITVNIVVSQDGDWGASGAATVTVSGASTTYAVSTGDDDSDETDGSVTATVQPGTGYTVGTPSAGTVNISDDDPAPVGNSDTLMVSAQVKKVRSSQGWLDPMVGRPGQTLVFEISTSETAQQLVTISFTVESLRLSAYFDYCLLPPNTDPDGFRCNTLPRNYDDPTGILSIPKGGDSATVTVFIDPAAFINGWPLVDLKLTSLTGAKDFTNTITTGRVRK